ncbi:asparaginyl-tRNA synthetase [Scheffersomyces amazonensis]|uniref:asparaginyl-tRNA synthetase n=1 Tax=Scheffersomyces amazonensis TaxID=1078765 RepID=UPI00315D1512
MSITVMNRSVWTGRRFLSSLNTLRPTIRELIANPPAVESEISAVGHIKSIRQGKNAGFIDVSDGSSANNLAVVIKNPTEVLQNLNLKIGQSINVKGQWVESQGTQPYELVFNPNIESHELSIIGDVPDTYPIQKKNTTIQNLRHLPTIRHRTSTLASILRFRSFMETKFIEFFNSRQFIKVSPPIVTASDCEGAGEQFRIESTSKWKSAQKEPEDFFFGKNAYLTVSTQLHLEVLALSLNRVWTLTPCFRAEVSNTNRHLSEFWMLEAEICNVDSLRQVTKFSEDMIRYVTQAVKDSATAEVGNGQDLISSRFGKDEIDKLNQRWDSVLTENEWPTISYSEAIEIINRVMNKGRSKNRLQWGDSLQTVHEKWLASEHFKSPVFITDYPASQKPFYMPESQDFNPDKPTVACFDLIFPEIGELIGGSLREHSYDKLIHRMKDQGMNLEDMEWFISTRLNGSIPHGGFGMGFERLISYLSAMENVKDVIPFPRVSQSCYC